MPSALQPPTAPLHSAEMILVCNGEKLGCKLGEGEEMDEKREEFWSAIWRSWGAEVNVGVQGGKLQCNGVN